MKAGIHPDYQEIKVNCTCGNSFEVGSTLEDNSLHVEVCNKCHPFYTGKRKIIDSTGRFEKYKRRFVNPKQENGDKVGQ